MVKKVNRCLNQWILDGGTESQQLKPGDSCLKVDSTIHRINHNPVDKY